MYDKSVSDMPWLSIPFEDPRTNEFVNTFKIKSLPTLVVLGNRGELVTMDGRFDLMMRGFDAWIHWTGIQKAEVLKRRNTVVSNNDQIKTGKESTYATVDHNQTEINSSAG
jgi:Thioredoxin-like